MQIEFEATAYLNEFTTLEQIASGKILPSMSVGESNFYTSQGYPVIGTARVILTLESQDKIVSQQVAALKARLHTVRAENQARENHILDQISKLQALTFSGEVAA